MRRSVWASTLTLLFTAVVLSPLVAGAQADLAAARVEARPALPVAVAGVVSETERAWFGAGAALDLRATQTRRRALQVGAQNLEPAARALVAVGDATDAVANGRLAVKLAPDLPVAHMALAAAYWKTGQYGDWLVQIFDSVIAIPRHLEASIWLAGSLLMMVSVVLIGGSIFFIFFAGTASFSRAAHDLGDVISTSMPGFARAAFLIAIVGLPLALGEGLLGLLLGFLTIGVIYGTGRQRFVLTLAAGLLMIGLYPMLNFAGTALDALDSDPVASAGLAVLRDSATAAQVTLLQEAELQGDALAARVLAVRATRLGDEDRARARFTRLFEEQAADPLVLTALGNMAFRAGRNAEAIDYYERAQALEENAVLMFDLSQAYAREFRMEEFEYTMQRGQAIDPDLVAELSGLGDPEFVADAPFSTDPIRARMLSEADGSAFVDAMVHVVAPGRLGDSPAHMAGGLALVLLAGTLLTTRFQHASRCSRCGRRICVRCDDSMWSADLCDGCHHLFNRPQGTDPGLRMARISQLRARESRIDKLATAASLVIPGASGLLAKRPGLAFLSILFFGLAVALIEWRNGVVPDPLAVGNAGPLAFVAAGGLMVLLYLGLMLAGIMIRRSQ